MRKSTHTALFASLAVLAGSGAPLAALGPASKAGAVMEQGKTKSTPSKKDVIGGWPKEKQPASASWPAKTQDYYWTLSPTRQKDIVLDRRGGPRAARCPFAFHPFWVWPSHRPASTR